jgi:hypothetical protein
MHREDPYGGWFRCFEVGHHQVNFKASKATSHRDLHFALFQYNFYTLI